MYLQLSIAPLESRLRMNCFSLFGHVERREEWINHCTQGEVDGCQGRVRLRKTWKDFLKDDLRLWNIDLNMIEQNERMH